MGVIIDEFEITSSIPPIRLFKSYILDSNHLLPKILPEFFKGFETIEGDGGIGSVKLITFIEGGQVKTAKNRTDEIDEANHIFKYTLIEGDALGEDFESVSTMIKIETGPNGGSVFKTTFKYHTKRDNHHTIQEKIKQGKEGAKAFFHAVEAHLHAHPHEYN